MNGRMNEAKIAIAQIPALVAINLFFSDKVIMASLLLLVGCEVDLNLNLIPAGFNVCFVTHVFSIGIHYS